MTGAFALAMAVSLAACGGGNKEAANEGSEKETLAKQKYQLQWSLMKVV